MGPGIVFTPFLKSDNVMILLKSDYKKKIITSNLARERSITKISTVLGNGELGVTEPDNIIYLKSLKALLDVATLEVIMYGFCRFSWFLFLS